MRTLDRFTLLFFISAIFPATVSAADNETEIHRIKAQKLIDAKDWTSAEPDAKAVVDSSPQDPDGWLVYGIVEQRLEHDAEAARAYRKYLELNPPEEKAAIVRSKLAEVEIRSQKEEKEAKEKSEERYGSRSSGVFFTYAPVYHPSTSSVLSGSVSSDFQFGVQLSHVLLGFLYANGTVPSFQAPPEGSSAVNPTFTTVGPANLKIYELFMDYNIPLTDAFEGTGPFAIYIPLHMGAYQNTLQLSDGSRTFGNISGDLATGIGVQWFNRSPLTLGVSGLFHYGLPLWSVEEDSNSQAVKTPSGDNVTGGNSCFELRITVTFLFGYEKTVAEKAGAQ